MVQYMRAEKQQAVILRKKGKSYNEIAETLAMPKSTLHYWFRDKAWSVNVKRRLVKAARAESKKRMTILGNLGKQKRAALYRECQKRAEKEFKRFKKENLFLSGLCLYWGEGDSKLENGKIRIANSDHLVLRLFYLFLRQYLPELLPKAKIYLVLYKDLEEKVCQEHWSAQVGVPLDKFIKSSYIVGRSPTKRLAHGIGTLLVSSRAYKEIIHTWLALFKKEIAKMRV